MSTACTDVICKGINGIVGLVTPFLPGAGQTTPTSTPETSSAPLTTLTTPTIPTTSAIRQTTPIALTKSNPPLYSAAPSSISVATTEVPAPAATEPAAYPPSPEAPLLSTTTEVHTSTSVIVTDFPATGTVISDIPTFISDLPTTSTSNVGSGPLSTSSDTAQSASTSPSNAETAASIVAQPQSFPTGLVVGLTVTFAALAVSGIALWYFCLKKRARKYPAFDFGGEGAGASVVEIYRPNNTYRGQDETLRTIGALPTIVSRGSTMLWTQQTASRNTSMRSRPSSIRTLPDAENPFDDVENNFPEPLSPRPVVQQTVQRVSMPRPVDVSSLKSGSRASSFGGSSIRSNTYSVRQVVVKKSGPGVAHSRLSSSSSSSSAAASTQARSKMSVGTISATDVPDLAIVYELPGSEVRSVTSATSLEVPVGLIPEETSPSFQKSTNYTVRRSPLAQNPFTDPSEEDWPMQSSVEESMMPPALRIVNPDTSEEVKGDDENSKPPQDVETEQQSQEAERHQEKESKEDWKEDEQTLLNSVQAPKRVDSMPPVPAIVVIPEQT